MKMIRTLTVLAGCLFTTMAGAASDYPRKTIQVVVPYGMGGAVDVAARTVAEHMTQTLGQPVVVLNRPGGNATIGPTFAAQSPADGYTLLASSSATVINPLADSKLSWNKDSFVPIARIVRSPNVIVVPASANLKTLADFVAHAKATPGLLTPVTGVGSSQAVARESFARAAYKGGLSFITDLVAGTLMVSVSPMNVVFRLVKTGQLTALANTGEHRSELLPDVPTMIEAGYPDATSVSWGGLHAPAGTPADILAKLSEAARAATEDPQIKARLTSVGAEAAFLAKPQFEKFLIVETVRAEKFLESIAKKK